MPPSCSPMLPLELIMDSHTRYSLFEKYILSSDQLKQNHYPIEHHYRPDRIYIPNDSIYSRWSSTRRCIRCKQYYRKNMPACMPVSPCFYHPNKIDAASQLYPCCHQAFGSPGCSKGRNHVSVECDLSDVVFLKTRSGRSKYACNVFALDCEMVYTEGGMELAKIGIVNTDGKVLYESFVLPEKPIVDYNTEYSGVTSDDLTSNAVPFYEAQKIVLGLVTKDTILVGHGLENDLRALRLIHKKVVDTSVIFPRERAKYKRSLKSLAMEFLNKDVQTSANGHDSTEDARTAMELMIFKIKMDSPSSFPVAETAESLNPAYRALSPAHPALARMDVVPVSNMSDSRTFLQDENNGDQVSSQPRQSSSFHGQSLPEWMLQHVEELRRTYSDADAWAIARDMFIDICLNTLSSYTQQPENQRMRNETFTPRESSMGQSHFPTSDIEDSRAVDRLQLFQFENHINEPIIFGFEHKGEWYPVRYHVMLDYCGHVNA